MCVATDLSFQGKNIPGTVYLYVWLRRQFIKYTTVYSPLKNVSTAEKCVDEIK